MRWLAMGRWSLRRKLIVACVLVELAAMLMVLTGGARLMQQTLEEQATVQAQEVIAVLNQALVAPLVQRDYATVQQILDQVRDPKAFPYLVLLDHRGRLVASSGWDDTQPLPARDVGAIDLDRPDATLHMAEQIGLAGQDIARLELGMSTARLLRLSIIAGFVAFAVAWLVTNPVAILVALFLILVVLLQQGRFARADDDFRASERMAQLIVQVAGRAGRGFCPARCDHRA